MEEFNMKVMNISDINGFFNMIDHCEGKIELVTNEGDRLNLKSKLSQYVSLAKVFSDGTIEELRLIVHNKSDVAKLMHFLYYGNVDEVV